MNHDLEVYKLAFPSANYRELDIQLFPIADRQAYLRFTPSYRISSGLPDYQFRLWSTSSWQSFSLFIEPVIVNSVNGNELLGTDYSRAGMSGRIVNSFLRYENNLINIQFGRSPVWWGQSWESSIIQSGHFPSYDNLSTRFNIGDFQMELLSGQLSSEYISVDGDNNEKRIKRYIAGHRVTWLPRHDKWVLSIGEQIIYTGQDRSLELFYLNPAIPYFFSALEGDEMTDPDNDNSIIFINGRYLFKPNLSAYFEFILDEYQVDKNTTPHALGYNIGLDGGTTLKGKDLSFEFEYTNIDSWTYIHHGQYTAWQNRGHPIGYRYGADCQSLMALIDFWLKPDWLISTKYTYLEKGANNLMTEWDSPGTKDAPFPSPPVTRHSLLVTSMKWFLKYGILEIGYSNYPVGNAEIDGVIDKPKGSLFFKAQLIWDLGYDLDYNQAEF